MRLRIHHALFAGFLGVVGLLVLLIVLLVGTGLKRELVRIMQGQLESELELVQLVLTEGGLPASDPQFVARRVGEAAGYRITIIDSLGTVIGDSEVVASRLPEVENHADRPEVAESRRSGSIAFSERVSSTVGQRLLYAAQPGLLDQTPVTIRIAAPLAEIDRAVSRSQGQIALTGLLSMLLALAVAYGLSRGLARPLVVLSDRAGQLASGDFSQRAPRNSVVTELDELSLAFNQLADELQARLGELGRERDEMQALIETMAEGVIALTDDARVLRTNRAARELLDLPESAVFTPVGTIVRHPELRALLEASVAKASQASELQLGDRHLIVASRMLDQGGAVTTFLEVTEIRRLEQVRRDFVANASHELKTPLTSIRGFAETLLDDEPPADLRKRFLAAIRDNTLRLQRLVEDLLDLSRLESGGWVAHPQAAVVENVARSVWETFRSEAEDKDVAFGIEGSGVAMADVQGLEQIYRNLFENALRYTSSGGAIEVSIRRIDDRIEVGVHDTGSGVPRRALGRIFERFYRADTARDREVGGTGLGLAIVRHLVQAMNGEVSAESELGRGTTIGFWLPASDEVTADSSLARGA